MIALASLLALHLFATAPAASVPTPAAPGAPRFVQLGAVRGLPADSSSRYLFMGALRSVFAESDLNVESADGGTSESVPNRFRLLEGDPADDVWQLTFTVGAPPPVLPAKKVRPNAGGAPRIEVRRASRGFNCVLDVQPPAHDPRGAELVSLRQSLVFPPSDRDTLANVGLVRQTGTVFPWAQAGEACGRLALETLMHRSGDLPAARRAALSPVLRVGSRTE